MRVSRTPYKDLPEEEKKKSLARAYANVYQRRGKLLPQPCYVCLSPKAEKHHSDYSKPLEVQWICRKCHLELHRKEEEHLRWVLNRAKELEEEEKNLAGT